MKAICMVDTRNQERYVDECVRSCLDQTVPAGVAYSVHAIDAGSTDGTVDRLRAHGDRITVHARDNVGQSGAFDLCLQLDADVFMFCDGDDRLSPHRLQRVLNVFAAHPDVVLVGNSITEVDAGGTRIRDVFVAQDRLFDARTDQRQAELLYSVRSLMGTSRMAVRKSALAKVLPFDRTVLFEADELIFNVLPQLGPVFIIGDRLTDYRLHGKNNYQNTEVSLQRVALYGKVHEDLLACLQSVRQRLDLQGPYIALSERGLVKLCRDVRAYERALTQRRAALALALREPQVLGFPSTSPFKRAAIAALVASLGLPRLLAFRQSLSRLRPPASSTDVCLL